MPMILRSLGVKKKKSKTALNQLLFNWIYLQLKGGYKVSAWWNQVTNKGYDLSIENKGSYERNRW